jgi:diguanylate cyclase (GGDEF)-like protein
MATELTPDYGDSRLEDLKAAAMAAGRATSEASYLQEATEHLSRLTHTERCSLLLVDDGHLRRGGSLGLSDAYLDAIDGIEVGPTVGTCGRAAAIGQPVITPDIEADQNWDGFREFAAEAGLRSCWSIPLVAGGRVLGCFATYSDAPHEPSDEQVELACAHAALAALGIEHIRRQQTLTDGYGAVVTALTSVLDVRDEYTAEHSAETARLATVVGRRMGLGDAEVCMVEQVAVLHDIGKLGVPTDILKSPSPLSDEEWAVIREHPVIGERILASIPFLCDVAKAVRHEHERWDGAGYPDRLSGDAIPLASRIVFACDAWHAMVSDRPYRAALDHDDALRELRENAGSQFDPEVVECLVEALGEPQPEEVNGRPDTVEPPSDLAAAAEAVGADDVFVFRKVSPDRFVHFDGVGRGAGWAGNVELCPEAEEHFTAALEAGEPLFLSFPRASRVVGPYYARSAVLVACGPDLVVVFGASDESLASVGGERVRALAERAAARVEEVSPAKRLADELEVLEAVKSVTTTTVGPVEETLRRIAEAAAAALSCEFGALIVLGEGREPRLGYSARGWTTPGGGPPEEVLAPFANGEAELPLLMQDVMGCGEASASLAASGATAIHALPIGDPALAVMVMVHADPVPRGFTTLCQRVARAVSESAEIVIRRALVHEELSEENARLSQRVRTDALTGVASRAAWDEALRREELHRGRSGAHAAVALFDVDDLKSVNDRHGHAAGDELLKECARTLAEASRATDLVARIGGDEFAVLLRYSDEAGAKRWCERVAQIICAGSQRESVSRLSVASGFAAAPPGEPLAAALAEADRRMYGAKRAVSR